MALFKKNKKDIKSSKGYLDKVRAEQKKRSEDELHLLEIRTMAKDLARFSIPEEKLSQLQNNKQKQEQKEKYKRAEGEGRKKIFEVRETENDISFLRNYLSKDLIEEMDLYLYKKQGTDWKVVEKDWEVVRDVIVSSLTNCGFPYIVVEDGDYGKQGDLYLKHIYEGVEMDVFYLEKTLPCVYQIWGRKVHIETIIDSKNVVFSFNGEKIGKKFL